MISRVLHASLMRFFLQDPLKMLIENGSSTDPMVTKWSPRESYSIAGWQKLRERGSGAPRKVRVFYERKDLQHTLFCRET